MKKVLLMIIVFMFSMNLYSVEKDVSIKVESIQNIPKKKTNGKSWDAFKGDIDIFVQATINDEPTASTEVIQDVSDSFVTINETLNLFVDLQKSKISFIIYDKDVNLNDFVCEINIQKGNLKKGKSELKCNNGLSLSIDVNY